jgi:signal transduction histidine kinase/ligand-binding sensor domain-containing protein
VWRGAVLRTFLVAALLPAAFGNLAALPADRAVSQYVRRAWTVEQGLPHGTVRGLAQTADGYLWLATYEGLVRFNGERFRILDKTSSPGLISNSITTLCRGRDDTLWLGTLAGVVREQGGRFENIALPGGADVVNAIAAADDGAIWVGTLAGRVIRVVNRRAEAVPLPLPPGPITALATAGGTTWIGTGRGLVRIGGGPPQTWTAANGLSSETIVSLLVDGDAVFAGTAVGLDRIAGGKVTRIGGLPVDQVTALRRDRDGNLWIGTYGNGVVRLSSDGRLSRYGLAEGVANPTVRAIFEDDEGSLWIGTNGGVEQLRVGAFITWSRRDGLADAVARVIFEDRDGVLWVGTANGLSRWEHGEWRPVNDARLTRILSIAQTRDGALWFGTTNGVYRVLGGKTTLFTTEQGLSSNTVRAIHQDRRGDVWIATDFGLNRVRPDGRVESFAGRGGLGTDYAMAIAEGRDGRIWVATGRGLAEFDGTAFRLHSAPRELPSNRLFALAVDPDGTVWITTDADGLVRYRNGKSSVITTRNLLPTDKILSLVDDEKGNLWFGTARGAFVSSKRNLNEVADGKSPTLDAPLFDENDGLGSRQCNGLANPAALRTRDGRIWFVTANGVSALTNVRPPQLPPRLPIIERVSVDGRDVTAAALLSIPPGTERLEFAFSGVTFVTPERLRVRYRLDGYDKGWIDAGTGRVASYTHLPAGDYHFVLATSRHGSSWSTTSLPLTLQPHFYQATWFIALSVLAVVGLLLAIHSFRMQLIHERALRLEKVVEERTRQISEEKERTEIALQRAEAATREAERHEKLTEEALAHAEAASRTKSVFLATTSHELRTPLNAIIGFSEILLSQLADSIEPRYGRFLSNIHSSGLYLLGHINNILDLSKIEAGRMEIQPEVVDVQDVVEGICNVMRGVATMRDVVINVDIPSDLPHITADSTQIRQILYNLMSNAVKFSPEHSAVTVRARRSDDDAVEICVKDQGIGIDPKDHQLIFQEFRQAHGSKGERPQGTGLGLALVKRFVEMHNGTIRVESAHGQGSTFVIVLPRQYQPGAPYAIVAGRAET